MPKHMLSPQGDYAPAGLVRRLAAMFYDFLLCVALMMVVTLVYQQGILRLIYGSDHLRELADRGALIGDPLLSTLLVFALFGFFAKFWTHNGQTLGMQVWGLRVQNRDGSAISLLQALLRFMIATCSRSASSASGQGRPATGMTLRAASAALSSIRSNCRTAFPAACSDVSWRLRSACQ